MKKWTFVIKGILVLSIIYAMGYFLFLRVGDEELNKQKLANGDILTLHRYNCGATCSFSYSISLSHEGRTTRLIQYEAEMYDELDWEGNADGERLTVTYPKTAKVFERHTTGIKGYDGIVTLKRKGGEVAVPKVFKQKDAYFYDDFNENGIELYDAEGIASLNVKKGTKLNRHQLAIGEYNWEQVFYVDTSKKNYPVYLMDPEKYWRDPVEVASSYEEFRGILDELSGTNLVQSLWISINGVSDETLQKLKEHLQDDEHADPDFWRNIFPKR